MFDTPTSPVRPNAHLIFLTPAQSQESDGTGNSTQPGTLSLTSPNVDADGTCAPAALFVFTGGTAGLVEENTQQGGQGGTNDATHGTTGPSKDARNMEQCNAIPTQATAPAVTKHGEDTDAN